MDARRTNTTEDSWRRRQIAGIARLETGIALTTLVQRLPGLALATTSIERLPNLAIRGVRALPVTFTT